MLRLAQASEFLSKIFFKEQMTLVNKEIFATDANKIKLGKSTIICAIAKIEETPTINSNNNNNPYPSTIEDLPCEGRLTKIISLHKDSKHKGLRMGIIEAVIMTGVAHEQTPIALGDPTKNYAKLCNNLSHQENEVLQHCKALAGRKKHCR